MIAFRRTRMPLLLLLLLAILIPAGGLLRQQGARSATDATSPMSYSIKFLCGFQSRVPTDAGEPPVKPGNYATEINIQNYHLQQAASLDKQVILLAGGAPGAVVAYREPSFAMPISAKSYDVTLPPGAATMDDCNLIWRMLGITPSSTNFVIGYLVIRSTVNINVDAVYTAEVGGTPNPLATTTATGISEEVLHIAGNSLP